MRWPARRSADPETSCWRQTFRLAVPVENLDDSLRRVTVPEGRSPVGTRRVRESPEGLVQDPTRVAADDAIGPVGDGHRPFGRVAKREARDPPDGGFFLKAARIGQHQSGATHEGDEIEVAEGIDVHDALAPDGIAGWRSLAPVPRELFLDPGVDGEHDRNVA